MKAVQLQTATFPIDNSLHFISIEITMIISSERCMNKEECTLPVFEKWKGGGLLILTNIFVY